nr:MAG TPA: hypothetical protein [Caudoviricetes sp.]
MRGTNRHRINGFHHTKYNALSAPLTIADGAFLMPFQKKRLQVLFVPRRNQNT